MDYWTTYWVVYSIISLIVACIMGAVTKHINESKGRDGGFAWGFWLGAIGIIVVACRPSLIDHTATPSRSYYGSSQPSLTQNGTPANGWRCTCGKSHYSYESSCICGRTKASVAVEKLNTSSPSVPKVVEAAPAPQKETAPQPQPALSEEKTLELLKEYKGLLDSGVISQEEFDAKKKQLLKL